MAVIVAAGQGSRMLPLSEELPKCMLPVQTQSILHRALITFRDLGIKRSVVIGGYKSDKLVLLPGSELVLNDQYLKNNILHSLAYARPAMDGNSNVLLAYSDIIFRPDIVESLLSDNVYDISILVDQMWADRYVGRTLHPLAEAEAAYFDNQGRLLRIGKSLLTPLNDSQNWGEPNVVFRSTDGRKFGLSPIPKKVYRVWFFAWDLPTALDAHGDAIVFPDMYTPVLLARARYYMWQFKDNPQASAFALDDYKKGLRQMRSNLLNPIPNYMTDDRVRAV